MLYNLVEHFYSIQGEGSWSGRPATFIRLHGCNLKCSFCDEPLHTDAKNITKHSKEDILKLCSKSDLVVITGGEPSLNDLNHLIEYLQANRKKVAVETNGYNYSNIRSADLTTLSPKGDNHYPKGIWDDIKLLVSADTASAVSSSIPLWKKEGSRVFLSAINGMKDLDVENNKLATHLALKYNVTINVQLHKILGVR